MSNNDNRAPFHYIPFQNPNPSHLNNQHPSSSSSHNINGGHHPFLNQQQLGFHEDLIPSQIMSFRDFFHRSVDYTTLSEAFDISYSSPEVMVDHHHHHHGNPRGSTTQQQQQQQIASSPPLNSPFSSSSNEAEADGDLKIRKNEQKDEDHMGDKEDLGKSKKGYV